MNQYALYKPQDKTVTIKQVMTMADGRRNVLIATTDGSLLDAGVGYEGGKGYVTKYASEIWTAEENVIYGGILE